jgi:tripartite-type tricarboxylate transporter receptor subunit TctC
MEAKQTIRMGTSGVGSSGHNETLIFIAATGAKHLKAVPGYPGNDLNMGLMRGDVDATINSYDNMFTFINEGEARVLLKLTKRPIKGLKGDIPSVYDIVKDENGLKLLALVDQLGELGRLTTAPPNTRPERLAVLREAYKKALTDPDLTKEGHKAGFEFDPMYGDDVTKLAQEIMNQPPANVELLKKILGKKQ